MFEFVNILENRSTREFVSYSPETCILLMSNTFSLLSPSFRIITSVENNLLCTPDYSLPEIVLGSSSIEQLYSDLKEIQDESTAN